MFCQKRMVFGFFKLYLTSCRLEHVLLQLFPISIDLQNYILCSTHEISFTYMYILVIQESKSFLPEIGNFGCPIFTVSCFILVFLQALID